MAKLDVMGTIRKSRGVVNDRYDLTVDAAIEIRNNSSGYYDLVSNTFRFGYMQGMKAAKAEQRRGRL